MYNTELNLTSAVEPGFDVEGIRVLVFAGNLCANTC